ncbi:MAG: hypothetical protein AB7O62_16670 [Pirellulales bacterium]
MIELFSAKLLVLIGIETREWPARRTVPTRSRKATTPTVPPTKSAMAPGMAAMSTMPTAVMTTGLTAMSAMMTLGMAAMSTVPAVMTLGVAVVPASTPMMTLGVAAMSTMSTVMTLGIAIVTASTPMMALSVATMSTVPVAAMTLGMTIVTASTPMMALSVATMSTVPVAAMTLGMTIVTAPVVFFGTIVPLAVMAMSTTRTMTAWLGIILLFFRGGCIGQGHIVGRCGRGGGFLDNRGVVDDSGLDHGNVTCYLRRTRLNGRLRNHNDLVNDHFAFNDDGLSDDDAIHDNAVVRGYHSAVFDDGTFRGLRRAGHGWNFQFGPFLATGQTS